jgi:hypothetical protein
MPRIKCFMLESTGKVSVSLRRYSESSSIDKNICPVNGSYHNARVLIEEEPVIRDEKGYVDNGSKSAPPHNDPRWPAQCACGYVFSESDEWQRFTEEIYKRVDTGEELHLRDAPSGAMWYAWWLDDMYTPQGEHNLVVKTPGGEWTVDGQANNCTMKDDMMQVKHHCWIRHGEPPNVTVSKEGGPTCGAGAGSIQCNNYHGFLRNGYLED